jgi:predicted alpha/beta superfamily hydrolase
MVKFICAVSTFFLIIQINAQELSDITIGKRYQIYSETLEENREYWVSLPSSYHSTEAATMRYPLLVLLDGNIHFESISGLANYMSRGRSPRIPELIIVGIRNVDRGRDYTPDKVITTRKNNTGGGDLFVDFLEKELMPQLDKQYRIADKKILFGHSLGGLLATHVYLKEKTLFNSFIVVDPSLGTWDNAVMTEKLSAVSENSYNRYLFLATANWGKRNFKNRDRHVRLYEWLHSNCDGEFLADMKYYESESHSSVPPIAFYDGILALFDTAN